MVTSNRMLAPMKQLKAISDTYVMAFITKFNPHNFKLNIVHIDEITIMPFRYAYNNTMYNAIYLNITNFKME